MTLDLVLSGLESSPHMDLLGNMIGAPVSITANCVATYEVSLADFKAAFQFSTDSDTITDISAQDLRYYVIPSGIKSAFNNVSNASTKAAANELTGITDSSGSPVQDNKRLVKFDFVRYLSLKLFNTTYGADLFSNQAEIIGNINKVCSTNTSGFARHTIFGALDAVSTTAGLATVDISNNSYLTNDTVNDSNLSRELFKQLVNGDTTRFQNLSTGYQMQQMPFGRRYYFV
jgi:hypothetical protein